ncbi:MAG: hypothetical protein OXC31_18295 [Spirochaetaceae bacterium]|nr:hypothetical protein [Spirochaetaceae bacterium]
MNKAMNTAVFMVAATAFSLVMMVVVILISIVLVGWLTQMGLAQGVASVLLVVFTLAGLAGSFFAYGRVIKLVDRKIDLSSKIYPLFQRKRR